MLKRRYVSASRIDGWMDTERVKSGPPNCLERDTSQLFNLTYVTEDLQAMLRCLSRRFDPNGGKGQSPGLILAEGVKGQGKSHEMILTYHLGQGLSEPKLNGIDRPLEGKRYREFASTEDLPARRPGFGSSLRAAWR